VEGYCESGGNRRPVYGSVRSELVLNKWSPAAEMLETNRGGFRCSGIDFGARASCKVLLESGKCVGSVQHQGHAHSLYEVRARRCVQFRAVRS